MSDLTCTYSLVFVCVYVCVCVCVCVCLCVCVRVRLVVTSLLLKCNLFSNKYIYALTAKISISEGSYCVYTCVEATLPSLPPAGFMTTSTNVAPLVRRGW